MTGRKETGKKGTTEKAAGEKVSNQGDAKRRSYSEAVIEGALRTGRKHSTKTRPLPAIVLKSSMSYATSNQNREDRFDIPEEFLNRTGSI
ncbi:hypothetical protein NP493_106g00012 [Ridgeia piscesae]|uniref:Uncharacterized protein n=1 Tax=Ridgeia piscesae TaxID=27915 RepID=A0AAD9UHE3_RIDPI|nr:hypothetical protein NP493_106g00012 [Ridgeia piscesae]